PSPTFFTILYRPSSTSPARLTCVGVVPVDGLSGRRGGTVLRFAASVAGVGAAAAGTGAAAGAPGAVGASRVPSRVQNFASSGYIVPHVGHRVISFAPGCGRWLSRDTAPHRPEPQSRRPTQSVATEKWRGRR